MVRDAIVISSDDDEVEVVQPPPTSRPTNNTTKPAYRAPKNRIPDSDSDEEASVPPPSYRSISSSAPSFPIPQPYHESSQGPKPLFSTRHPLPTTTNPPPFPPRAPFPNNRPQAVRPPTQMPIPIPIPVAPPRAFVAPLPPTDPPGEETFSLNIATVEEVQETADDAQKAMRDLVAGALVSDNLEDVNLEDRLVDGFREGIELMPHQIQGRAWMRERETGKRFGGILADMGLGKTIQTLARIVEGKPTKADRKDGNWAKTTLIVTPVSVLPQWAEEIKKMCKGLTVIKHHGPSRTTDPDILKAADVVITTYQTLSSELATYSSQAQDASTSKKAATSDDDSDDSLLGKSVKKKPAAKGKAKAKPFALYEIKWWRIVLDEAQNIKNKNTKAAQGCFALKGKYRWVLTGTPIQNSVDELYSLFNFLKIRPLNSWDSFQSQISKPVKAGRSKNAMKRLHVVLQATMLRRTKDQTLNGKVLITLPDRNVEVIDCQFDDDERNFYKALEDRTSVTMNKYINEGTVMSNYTSVLILLLRLRQACDHPSLVSKDFAKDQDAIESKPPPPAAVEEEEAKKDVNDELADLLGGLGLSSETRNCNICQGALPRDATGKVCDDCETQVNSTSRRKSILGPGKTKSLLSESDNDLILGLPPSSAKIRMMLKLLHEIHARTKGRVDEEGRRIPPEKTIIFSQFTTMLDLVEPFLDDARIRYVRYDGSMKSQDREASINKIKTDPKTRVILISFKAGGTGLNLTACNNVILLDLWWNPALEDQAFDRAHRLGQTKPVWIYKLTVPDTCEARILELQNVKRALAAAALSGGKIAKGGLSLDDLLQIFNRHGHTDDEEED